MKTLIFTILLNTRHHHFGSSMNKNGRPKIYFTITKNFRLARHIFSLLRALQDRFFLIKPRMKEL